MLKKTVIFDLDGTLYSGEHSFLKFLDLKTEKFLIKECPFLTTDKIYEMEQMVPSIIEAIDLLKISREKYYNEIFSNINYESFFTRDKKLIQAFEREEEFQENFIVSLAGYKQIEEITRILGIDKYFRDFYSLEKTKINSKKDFYLQIINKYKADLKKTCVVGDNYKVDLLPAIELGLKVIYINTKKKCDMLGDTVKDIYQAFEIL